MVPVGVSASAVSVRLPAGSTTSWRIGTMRKLLLLTLLLAATASLAFAGTASRTDIANVNSGCVSQGRADVVLNRTTDVALNQAFADLGVAYDKYAADDFSGLDLTP